MKFTVRVYTEFMGPMETLEAYQKELVKANIELGYKEESVSYNNLYSKNEPPSLFPINTYTKLYEIDGSIDRIHYLIFVNDKNTDESVLSEVRDIIGEAHEVKNLTYIYKKILDDETKNFTPENGYTTVHPQASHGQREPVKFVKKLSNGLVSTTLILCAY